MDSKTKRRAAVNRKHRKKARKFRKRNFNGRWLAIISVRAILFLGSNTIYLIRAVYSAMKIIGVLYTGIVAVHALFKFFLSFEFSLGKVSLIFFIVVIFGVLVWKEKE